MSRVVPSIRQKLRFSAGSGKAKSDKSREKSAYNALMLWDFG